jgi:hypothetical protein
MTMVHFLLPNNDTGVPNAIGVFDELKRQSLADFTAFLGGRSWPVRNAKRLAIVFGPLFWCNDGLRPRYGPVAGFQNAVKTQILAFASSIHNKQCFFENAVKT